MDSFSSAGDQDPTPNVAFHHDQYPQQRYELQSLIDKIEDRELAGDLKQALRKIIMKERETIAREITPMYERAAQSTAATSGDFSSSGNSSDDDKSCTSNDDS